jgi:hypothetical protein
MLHKFLAPKGTAFDRFAFVDSLEEIAGEPLLAAFFAYWKRLAGEREMPLASELDPIAMPRQALPLLGLFDVVGPAEAPRFRVRVMGTQASEQAEQDYTGRFVDEISGAGDVHKRFAAALKHRRPYYADAQLTWSVRDYKRYQVIICPLADDADPNRVGRLVGLAIYS